EVLPVHGATDGGVDLGADAQVALHALPAQVEVAVAQADVLVDVVGPGVDREGRRLGGRQHLDRAVADLDLTGGQGVVGGALRADADSAGDAHDVLAAQVVGAVDDALGDAAVVAQVDERQVLAVLATPADPAAQGHLLASIGGPQLPTEVGAHGLGLLAHQGRPR